MYLYVCTPYKILLLTIFFLIINHRTIIIGHLRRPSIKLSTSLSNANLLLCESIHKEEEQKLYEWIKWSYLLNIIHVLLEPCLQNYFIEYVHKFVSYTTFAPSLNRLEHVTLLILCCFYFYFTVLEASAPNREVSIFIDRGKNSVTYRGRRLGSKNVDFGKLWGQTSRVVRIMFDR